MVLAAACCAVPGPSQCPVHSRGGSTERSGCPKCTSNFLVIKYEKRCDTCIFNICGSTWKASSIGHTLPGWCNYCFKSFKASRKHFTCILKTQELAKKHFLEAFASKAALPQEQLTALGLATMGLAVFKVLTRFAWISFYFSRVWNIPSLAHQEAPLRRHVADEALHSNELAQLLLSQHRSKVLSGREDPSRVVCPIKTWKKIMLFSIVIIITTTTMKTIWRWLCHR